MLVIAATTADLDVIGDDYAALLERHLAKVAGQTRGLIRGAPSVDDLAWLRTFWQARLEDQLVPTLALVFEAGAAGIRTQLRDALTVTAAVGDPPVALADVPAVPQALVDAYLQTARNRLVGVGDLAWDQTRTQLLEGLRAGDTHEQLANRIQEAVGLALPAPR